MTPYIAIKKILVGIMLTITFLVGSCTKDLDVKVIDPDQITADKAYASQETYEQALAKVYAGLVLSGQQGPSGDGDISGIDEGFGQYLRGYWQLQELPTDEAIVGWADAGLSDLNFQTWDATNVFIYALYSRVIYQVTLANQFISESTDTKITERGLSSQEADIVRQYQAEARWLRALSYFHALDLFGNTPFVTEKDPIGSFLPLQTSRLDLFKYIESELIDIEDDLAAPRTNSYGRADSAAAWVLLAKLYLNAEVYTGTDRYADCINYCNKIISAGYSLTPNYQNLFLADNDTNGAQEEIIFALPFDGQETQTWGGVTYLTNASSNSDNKAIAGISGGWAGLRTTKSLVNKFDADADGRYSLLYTQGHELEIKDVSTYTDGYAVIKYRNINSDGSPGKSDISGTHASIDFPLFRLADVYLMFAEATIKGGGGDKQQALDYVNAIRTRSYGQNLGQVTMETLDSENFIIDERARELYWEATRRTDLIRFGQFTGTTYVWPWKGGIEQGTTTAEYLNLYPIPSNDLTANPKLKQNQGY